MYMEYIASLSYGKDSIAMLEIIRQYSMPIDRIVHVEIMATDSIPAELPEVIEWKAYADQKIFERYGMKVEHVTAKKTFEELFYSIPRRRPENKHMQGMIRGFPSLRSQWCSKELKVNLLKQLNRGNVQYIGIAADEIKRQSQLTDLIRSPLVEHGVTEQECMEICRKIGLLAPNYIQSKRSGCWFCPAQPVNQLRLLRAQHRELWELLLIWDKVSPIPFRHAGLGKRVVTVDMFDKRFRLEEQGVLEKDTMFMWKDLELYQNRGADSPSVRLPDFNKPCGNISR